MENNIPQQETLKELQVMELQQETDHFFPWQTPSLIFFSRSSTYDLLILSKTEVVKRNFNSNFFDSTHIINLTLVQAFFFLKPLLFPNCLIFS